MKLFNNIVTGVYCAMYFKYLLSLKYFFNLYTFLVRPGANVIKHFMAVSYKFS
jgi:hypothetical protein